MQLGPLQASEMARDRSHSFWCMRCVEMDGRMVYFYTQPIRHYAAPVFQSLVLLSTTEMKLQSSQAAEMSCSVSGLQEMDLWHSPTARLMSNDTLAEEPTCETNHSLSNSCDFS